MDQPTVVRRFWKPPGKSSAALVSFEIAAAAIESSAAAVLIGKMFEIGQEFFGQRNFEFLFDFWSARMAFRRSVSVDFKH